MVLRLQSHSSRAGCLAISRQSPRCQPTKVASIICPVAAMLGWRQRLPVNAAQALSFPFWRASNAISVWRGRHPRQSQWLVPADRMRPLLWSGLVNSLNSSLPSISDRLYSCPTHEDAAEAARSRIAEAQGDLRYALVGLKKQVARRIEAHFRNHVSVAGAHCSEMTLQRARAHPQLDCRAFKCRATAAQ